MTADDDREPMFRLVIDIPPSQPGGFEWQKWSTPYTSARDIGHWVDLAIALRASFRCEVLP